MNATATYLRTLGPGICLSAVRADTAGAVAHGIRADPRQYQGKIDADLIVLHVDGRERVFSRVLSGVGLAAPGSAADRWAGDPDVGIAVLFTAAGSRHAAALP